MRWTGREKNKAEGDIEDDSFQLNSKPYVPVTECNEPAKKPPEMVERATTGRPVTTFLAMLLRRGRRPFPEAPAGTTGTAAAARGARKRVKSGEGSKILLIVWGCRLKLVAARRVGRRTKPEA